LKGFEYLMTEKLKAGIVGGTGMVGQRFVQLLDQHPWFQVTAIAASASSAGKTYEDGSCLAQFLKM
jgi:aspartate-semialdehyde dehydrogenase